jgi:predicted CXXCH cytochrome family protein
MRRPLTLLMAVRFAPGVLALLAAVVLSCSSDARQRLTHFFFEVPDEPVAGASTEAAAEPAGVPELALPPARFASVHHPYAEQQCDACHHVDERMRVAPEHRDSCGDCHEDHFDEDLVKHEPVLDGDCSMCHVPHRSQHRALLIQPVFETCTDCHDAEDLSEAAHGAAEATNCVACHDAHFGGAHLLKTEYAAKTAGSD